MEEGKRVGGEDVPVAARAREPCAQVVGGVIGGERVEDDAAMKSGREEAISPDAQAVVEVAESDEDEGEQRLGVPLVVEQDVQMIERVLMEKVRLVEEKDGMRAPLARHILDVLGDGVEDRGSGGGGREAESEAELAVEVAPPERRVVAVGEAEAIGRERVPQCT